VTPRLLAALYRLAWLALAAWLVAAVVHALHTLEAIR
jgi:uncharacterized membrane protein YdfJ with MMPL/SSD domain